MNDSLKKITFTIHGTHCASCEVLIERKFLGIDGIKKVDVNHATGRAVVHCVCDPDLEQMQAAIAKDGYTIECGDAPAVPVERNTKRDYIQTGAIFLIVVALYLIARQFDLIPDIGISDGMSYGFVFLIGLVSATSTCLAVTGGLLLGMSAKYSEQHPGFSGMQKFKPTLAFNAGRIVGYTAFGAAVGGIGSAISLSPRATGIVTIAVSVVMILLGFQLLKLFPRLRRFQPKMPKFLAHKVHDLSNNNTRSAPFLLGAGTFFLPCGFTQALQLYVLSQGDALKGGLIMLAFALGTLPALLSLSLISSFAKGRFQGYFLKFAGVIVIMLAVFNIRNGVTLAGITMPGRGANAGAATIDSNVRLEGGRQIVEMTVTGLGYSPSRFTVLQGVPVEWRIDGRRAQGCASVITVPKLGITEYLSNRGVTTISFVPQDVGTIAFSCTMGMTTRGSSFTVVPNTKGAAPIPSEPPVRTAPFSTDCNPEIMNCVTAQRVSMEITRERGFYPNVFTVRKGIPVEFDIDTKVPLGGCMSTLVIREYDVGHLLKLGRTTVTFTPTRIGRVPFTCAMGIEMGEFLVVDS